MAPVLIADHRISPAGTMAANLLRILVVDDYPDMTQSTALLLESWGHDARCAATAKDALVVAVEFQPDVVILEVGMRGGWDLARSLRSELADVKLIAVTGFGHEHDRWRSRDAGCDLHLIKPVAPEELRNALTRRKLEA
jgi:DNA-binding response OmpR family regulator